jgi:subtilisin family serine protease
MAAPHVAGAIALMLSAHPQASLADLYRGLYTTAVTGLGNPPGQDACGGRRYDVFPNAIYGWGQIDALAAVNALH